MIRDYVRRRVLSPTERGPPREDGKESEERGFYTFRHLAEFLAARVLLNDGWPLEKIAERNQASTTEALLALIPGQESEALALARSFRRETPPSPAVAFSPPGMAELDVPLTRMEARPSFLRRMTSQIATDPAASAARSRAELPLFMRRLTGDDAPPRIRRLASIEVGEALVLLIDQRRAERMTLAEAELIGGAITAALMDYPKLSRAKEL